jgi:hypothetical protein
MKNPTPQPYRPGELHPSAVKSAPALKPVKPQANAIELLPMKLTSRVEGDRIIFTLSQKYRHLYFP